MHDIREKDIVEALRTAFARFVETKDVEIIVFSDMTATELGSAFQSYPLILKPILACCNVAARAIERDLGIKNLDTYSPRFDGNEASVLAGFIKQFLPPYLEIPSLARVDRVAFIDKEIRRSKGRWELRILQALNKLKRGRYRKRKFTVHGQSFELDAASPLEGDIDVGIDVKRVEARRDIHKRCDEIVNKASKMKMAFPESRFGAIVYYPFIDEHVNIQSRLRSSEIDGVVFASEGEDSIGNAVRLLLSTLAGEK